VRILQWAQQFEEVIWLDSNNHSQKHGTFKAILAVDALTVLKTDTNNAFKQLDEYQQTTKDWIFGYLSYDLKNDIEQLSSSNYDGLDFQDLYFFQPKKVFLFSENEVTLHYLNMVDDEIESDWDEICNLEYEEPIETITKVKMRLRTSKDSYYSKVIKVLEHIHRGDIYEANFCQEFYAEGTTINPLNSFLHLNEISRSPFATFLKLETNYAFSASPERYIKKTGTRIISQPIKGTAKRADSLKEDEELKNHLKTDPKERSENIMITDLVRNDLSKIAEKGSVQVEELCGIYTFDQVHQMISTITCTVAETLSPVTILRNTYPMGSMTGAPKVRAMELIEKYEDAKRGLYSGTIGYITPEGDFDFNVVIRSILYNANKKYVSASVGGAITALSNPEGEYAECLLKAKAMRQVLEND
jgi:para-aminobenzoate synthetase component 1